MIYIYYRVVKVVQESMHIAITMNKAEIMDAILDDFAKVKFALAIYLCGVGFFV